MSAVFLKFSMSSAVTFSSSSSCLKRSLYSSSASLIALAFSKNGYMPHYVLLFTFLSCPSSVWWVSAATPYLRKILYRELWKNGYQVEGVYLGKDHQLRWSGWIKCRQSLCLFRETVRSFIDILIIIFIQTPIK